MLQSVLNLINSNRLTEAKKLCEKLNRQNKKNQEIWLLLADIYQRTGEFDKAEKSYLKAIKLKSDNAVTHANLAMLYHGQGKLSKAEPCYRRSLKLDSNQAIVNFNLGAVLQEQNKQGDALVHYRAAIELKPDYAKAYANLGYILRLQKEANEAIDCYRKALKLAPDIPEIHYNLAMSLLETGQAEEAERHHRQALNLRSDYADAFAGLGAVQVFNGDTGGALKHYQQALKYQQDSVDILCAYANVLFSNGQHAQAMVHIDQALVTDPYNIDARTTKGFIHLSLGQLDDALDCCNQVLKVTPEDEKAVCLAAEVYGKKGDAQRAYRYLAPLLEHEPIHIESVLSFASISKSLDLVENAIELMERVLQNSEGIAIAEKGRLHFALGKAYDSTDDYDRAFINYQEANKLKGAVFNIKGMQNKIDEQINVFSSGSIATLKTASIRSNRPIFIVGMPRSGTSLVEQILCSHSQVTGAGELPEIGNMALSIQKTYKLNQHYPECLKQIDTQQLDSMTQAYLETLNKLDSNASYITDKMPGNFMHLGLIQLLFPDAHIIHCIRNPMDTCLSCYFQDFSASHPWVYDLQDTAKVYLEYQRMMQHWKNVLDIPIMDVHYEELVNNQETTSLQMIEFCGLEWEDDCLQFHKNKRFIWTASYDQVRQPMYNKSIARWKNYEPHIGDLIQLLRKS